jgi:hypothetical protein
MFDNGLLKMGAQGNYEAVVDPVEAESIRSEVSQSKRKKTMTPAEAAQIEVELTHLEADKDVGEDDEGIMDY